MIGNTSRLRSLVGWLPLLFVVGIATVGWVLFHGGGFRSILVWLGMMSIVPLVSLVVLLGTVVQAIRRRRGLRQLLATLVVTGFCLWPACWLFGVGTIRYPFDLATTHPSASVRLPTNAPMRVLWGGDDVKHNHHASLPDQRWAYDLAVDPVLTTSSRLEDFGCWGIPVVAPTSGMVHVAHDGEPDQAPGTLPHDQRTPLGNHVVIKLESGGYLVIAHLRSGSVIAREGGRVAEGEPIGACGNSGNTSEPHVHIHAQRQDPRDRPINFSEGLPLFFRGHDGPPMPAGGIEVVAGRAAPTGATVHHVGDRVSTAAPR